MLESPEGNATTAFRSVRIGVASSLAVTADASGFEACCKSVCFGSEHTACVLAWNQCPRIHFTFQWTTCCLLSSWQPAHVPDSIEIISCATGRGALLLSSQTLLAPLHLVVVLHKKGLGGVTKTAVERHIMWALMEKVCVYCVCYSINDESHEVEV